MFVALVSTAIPSDPTVPRLHMVGLRMSGPGCGECLPSLSARQCKLWRGSLQGSKLIKCCRQGAES